MLSTLTRLAPRYAGCYARFPGVTPPVRPRPVEPRRGRAGEGAGGGGREGARNLRGGATRCEFGGAEG
eukprot:441113-Prorocentrum_minimum.AAC.1